MFLSHLLYIIRENFTISYFSLNCRFKHRVTIQASAGTCIIHCGTALTRFVRALRSPGRQLRLRSGFIRLRVHRRSFRPYARNIPLWKTQALPAYGQTFEL
jgi:hypothetical protein